jgi:hypothetical protein
MVDKALRLPTRLNRGWLTGGVDRDRKSPAADRHQVGTRTDDEEGWRHVHHLRRRICRC